MEELRNKRVLVTGGSGFVGSHMARRMLKENARVYVMVRADSDLWRIADILAEVEAIRADIRDYQAVTRIIKAIQPEYVFHTAAYGVDSRQKDFSLAAETNVLGTINIISALQGIDCRKLVNIGSCMEYGDKKEPIPEDARLEPFNTYGSTKAAATIVAHQLAKDYGLDIVTLRAFGIFGENEGSHKFFPHIILSILKGSDVLLTACEQFRDYCYIENILDAMVMAAVDREIKNEIFNVGSGVIRQLKFYVDLVYQHIQGSTRPIYGAVPYRPDEVWRPHPDTAKIRSMLNWAPRVSLEDGLVRTINWYRENLEKFLGTGR